MAFTEDRSVFFNTGDFAVSFTYTPCGYPHESTGITETINGIFDYRYFESEGIQGEKPVILADESDISSPEQGDQITIASTIYTLVDWKKSGNGLIELVLAENDT